MADDLHGAFDEAYAISQGTKCKQFLFSLSLSPPEKEAVPVDVFEQAIAAIEEKLILTDQPRALVFHEKEGRRHAHCVWSRINANEMKAINLPHYKLKLRDISRELYLEHGWQMPRGLVNSEERNPLNFTQAEWQQAKRAKQDPRIIKELFQDCWAISDSHGAFSQALEERGFYLAKGDRRGFVAVDWRGETYAISRWVGIKTKEISTRLGNPEDLPSVADTKMLLAEKFSDKLRKFADETIAAYERAERVLSEKRQSLVNYHRQERTQLKQIQANRWVQESKIRSARLPNGLKALWFRVTGKYQQIKEQCEAEAYAYRLRDKSEYQQLIDRQLDERRHLQHEFRLLRHKHGIMIRKLNSDISRYLNVTPSQQDAALSSRLSQNTDQNRERPSRRGPVY